MKKKFLIISFILIIFLIVGINAFYFIKNQSDESFNQYRIAESLYSTKDYSEAYSAFIKIKMYSPYYKLGLFKSAITAEKLEDWHTVEKKLTKWIQFFNDDIFLPKAEYTLAKAYFYNQKNDKAKEIFLKILNSEQDKTAKVQYDKNYVIASNYFLGRLYDIEKEQDKAIECYLAYITQEDKGRYALEIAYILQKYNLTDDSKKLVAKIFIDNGKYKEAEAMLQNITPAETWTYLAVIAGERKNIKEFDELLQNGYSNWANFVRKDEIRDFTKRLIENNPFDFKDVLATIMKYSSSKSPIYDMILFYSAQNSKTQKDKIEKYKQIINDYPESEFIPDCLLEILLNYGWNGEYASAIKVVDLFNENFSDSKLQSKVLYWGANFAQKLNNEKLVEKYKTELKNKFPNSYYAFRVDRLGLPADTSWYFLKEDLPVEMSNDIEFPYDLVNNDEKLQKNLSMLVKAEDYTIWDDLPLNNDVIKSWAAYKMGEYTKSSYLAEKYISESDKPISFDSTVYKLAYPIHYAEKINDIAVRLNLDPFLVLSLIREESHFNPQARSSTNAIGLMQVMPDTADYVANIAIFSPPSVQKLFEPDYNIEIGSTYLTIINKQIGKTFMEAVGAYNAGPGSILRWNAKSDCNDTDEFVEKIEYDESRDYVKKVFRTRYIYSLLYSQIKQ